MSRIQEALSGLGGRGGLIAYVMGGDPNPSLCMDVIASVVKGGADVLEIGLPFSDPIADGRSIQEAGQRALASGTRPTDVLEIAAATKKEHDIPIALMTYYNPVFSAGVDSFLQEAASHGVDGLIVPDLPLEEAAPVISAAKKRGIDSILLAAPTTSDERMKRIASASTGFLYLVSRLGVTGARDELNSEIGRLVGTARRFTEGRIPLAVGFGISSPAQVNSAIAAGADAAVVGSAIVDKVALVSKDRTVALADIEGFVRSLKEATRRTGPSNDPGHLESGFALSPQTTGRSG